jgi:serine-threonine kinase receptor-associated protein
MPPHPPTRPYRPRCGLPAQPRPQVLATGGARRNSVSSTSPAAAATPPPHKPGWHQQHYERQRPFNHHPTPSYEIGPGVYSGTIKSIVWGTDLNILVTASDDKKIRWWDPPLALPINEYDLEGIVGSCELNTLSSDGSAGGGVLSVAAGKTAYFFDGLEPGRLLKTIKTPYEIASVALHSDQRRFVTGGSGDTWVRVYDFDEEKQLDVYKGHHGSIWSVSFSPDGKLYATGSAGWDDQIVEVLQ